MKTLTTAAMLMAVSVVLGYFTIEAGPYLKIGFGGVVNQFVYYLFGPVTGAVYGGVLDLVKYVVKPTGAFFPGFTLNAMLGGVLYGTILYRKPLTFRRALWADLVVALICNIFLNTLWLSMMSGKAMMVLLPMRVLKNLIKWPVDAALFLLPRIFFTGADSWLLPRLLLKPPIISSLLMHLYPLPSQHLCPLHLYLLHLCLLHLCPR